MVCASINVFCFSGEGVGADLKSSFQIQGLISYHSDKNPLNEPVD